MKLSPPSDYVIERPKLHLLLGLPFDALTLDEAVYEVESAIQKQKRCFLSTPNINFTIAASKDEAFFDSVVQSDLSVVDGMPLVWLASLSGLPIKERVAGSDLFQALMTRKRETPIRVFFFGGEEGVAEQAHQKLNDDVQGMESVGFYDPGFVSIDEMSQPHIIEKINLSKPDFLLVALGAKKGQAWIMANQDKLNAPVISHLGAVINFVAGHVERAPEKWQKFGLEWLWRVKQEPKLWRRYASDGVSLVKMLLTKQMPYLLFDKQYKRAQNKNGFIQWEVEQQTLILSGYFAFYNMEELDDKFEEIINSTTEKVVVDMENLTYVDDSFMARLLVVNAVLKEQQRGFCLTNIPKNIKRLMFFSNVSHRLTKNYSNKLNQE